MWITALGAFDLLTPGDFLPESQLWQTATPTLGATPLDAGMAKPKVEVLVAGDVCAPGNHPVRSLVVNLELGPIHKRLIAFGRRWWQHGPDGPVMSDPEPFERVRLGWENAFGGPEFADNPVGKGVDARKRMRQREPAELPQIESPESLIVEIDHHPAPASFGPRAEDAPARRGFAGTYDDAWLRDDFPNPAQNFDWRFYNAACPDQQTDAELSGDEPYRITSMHPDHREICGRLPGFRVRGFARQGAAFRELPMRCDTVWFFPNATMGIVLFRGGIAVADKEASDVPHVLLAYERLTDPKRTLAHYETALDERTDPELGAQKMFDERPIKPERLPEETAEIEAERQAIIEENTKRQEQAREHAIASCFRTAGLSPPPPGTFKDDTPPMPVAMPVITPSEISRLEVDMAGLMKSADAMHEYGEKENREQLAQIKRDLSQQSGQALGQIDPQTRPLVEERLRQASKQLSKEHGEGFDLVPSAAAVPAAAVAATAAPKLPSAQEAFKRAGEAIKRQVSAVSAKPKTESGVSPALRRARNRALGQIDEEDSITKALAGLDKADEGRRQTLAQVDGIEGGLPPAAPQPTNPFQAASAMLGEKNVANAPEGQKAAEKLSSSLADPKVAFVASAVEEAAAKSEPADPETAFAEARDKIEGMRGQIAALNADSRRMSIEPLAPDPQEPLSPEDALALGALALDLVGRNEGLQGRDLAGADLTEADLTGLDLSGIFLEKAVLKGAKLTGANLHEAVLTGADLTGADLTGADLTDSNLSGANFAEARLCEARLDNAQLHKTRFDQADLRRARLIAVASLEAVLARADLSGAEIRDANFIQCDLTGFSLDGANLHSVTFLETRMAGLSARAARFERCVLIGLDGEDADLTGLEFINSACIGGAKLNRAHMAGLVAPGSGWRGADLSGADLTAARLDESDLGETTLVGACLHRASLKRAVLHKIDGTGANFFGATLLEAQAQGADFTNASLHMANLYSADLTDAVFTLSDLTGANLTLTLLTKPTNAE